MNEDLHTRLLRRLATELRVLPDKPDETPEATLGCLWALAAGQPLTIGQLKGFVAQPLAAPAETHLLDLIERRLAGVPLAHLTGRQEFMGQVLLASPAALVPRRETEQLGFAAVERLRSLPTARPVVLDICTGAGNVALGIAAHVLGADVYGADLSKGAIDLARENASFAGRTDVEFRCGDLLEPFVEVQFRHAADVITCNPPYISSARVENMPEEISRHEPRLAFDGGPFGVGIIRRLVREAPAYLKANGWLLMEVGLGQGAGVVRSLNADGAFDVVNAQTDAHGDVRVVEARVRAR